MSLQFQFEYVILICMFPLLFVNVKAVSHQQHVKNLLEDGWELSLK